jgi:hypothetical protein
MQTSANSAVEIGRALSFVADPRLTDEGESSLSRTVLIENEWVTSSVAKNLRCLFEDYSASRR